MTATEALAIDPVESFEQMLSGGHPNSLGRTLEVVDQVVETPARFDELFHCYFCEDEVVRLRTSNAVKRVTKVAPAWLEPYIDQLLTDVANIKQASTQWTVANLLEYMTPYLSARQLRLGKAHLQHNLTAWDDWIVLKNTMQTLAFWAKSDEQLRIWLTPQLERLSQDHRKSVASKAKKLLTSL